MVTWITRLASTSHLIIGQQRFVSLKERGLGFG